VLATELAGEVTKRLARFVKEQPSHALGHFYYAMSLWKSGPAATPSPAVESELKQAVALDPRLARAHFELGVLYADSRGGTRKRSVRSSRRRGWSPRWRRPTTAWARPTATRAARTSRRRFWTSSSVSNLADPACGRLLPLAARGVG
jgi:hypothetical protein